jgi:xanthine dehydrogenase YagS FAD-binding subunit
MQPFKFQLADSVDIAISDVQKHGAKFIAGGTNLLDLMKGRIERPSRLIDITHLPLADIELRDDGALRIGALARNSDMANHDIVRKNYPLLAQALVAGASPQLRNMATLGGNLMQRTRCGYFTDLAFTRCNKRAPGSGCGAREGEHRNHAIFGASDACIAINPSDMSVALAALDAVVLVKGKQGERVIPIDDFHRLPGDDPTRDTQLAPDELILAVEIPPNSFAAHSHYLKVRERSSFAFALVSVAAALDIAGDKIRAARIAAGGVAHKPWRLQAVEDLLRDRSPHAIDFERIGKAAIADAKPLPQNQFKVPMLQAALSAALRKAAAV